MKLELRHLAPYLPYRLKYMDWDYELSTLDGLDVNGDAFCADSGEIDFQLIKPILRPLSDLTKEIEVNGQKFIPIDKLGLSYDWSDNISIYDFYPNNNIGMEDIYFTVNKLYEWHFDIFNLIENNLAIDINTINQ